MTFRLTLLLVFILFFLFFVHPANVQATVPPDPCPASTKHLLYQENPGPVFVCGIPSDDCVKIGGQYHCPARRGRRPYQCADEATRQFLRNFAGETYIACAPLSEGCAAIDARESIFDCRFVIYQARAVSELEAYESEKQSPSSQSGDPFVETLSFVRKPAIGWTAAGVILLFLTWFFLQKRVIKKRH